MGTSVGVGVLIAVVFAAGFGWGQWYAERKIRAERAELERGRLSVSMPMKEDEASSMLGLLQGLIGEVEREREAARAIEKARAGART